MAIEAVVSAFLDENCYVLISPDSTQAIIVDPGVGVAERVLHRASSAPWQVTGILLTHAHPDHVWDAAELSEHFDVPVYINERDRPSLADPLAGLGSFGLPTPAQFLGGPHLAVWREPTNVRPFTTPDDAVTPLPIGNLTLHALGCPGHSPGSTVFEAAGPEADPVLLTGDVLFANGIGRTDLPGGDPRAMTTSLRRLVRTFDHSRVILPGHGPSSTLGHEVTHSPYLTMVV